MAGRRSEAPQPQSGDEIASRSGRKEDFVPPIADIFLKVRVASLITNMNILITTDFLKLTYTKPALRSVSFLKFIDPGRGRTCNLLIRSQTPCPLGHRTSCENNLKLGLAT